MNHLDHLIIVHHRNPEELEIHETLSPSHAHGLYAFLIAKHSTSANVFLIQVLKQYQGKPANEPRPRNSRASASA
jgi:hypothetical protein